jgi:hypothetical protein
VVAAIHIPSIIVSATAGSPRKSVSLLANAIAPTTQATDAPVATAAPTAVATGAPTVAPTAAPTVAPTSAAPAAAAYPLACTAIALAKRGEWEDAETHWLSAEEAAAAAGDDAATSAFFQLVTDTETVALDQADGKSTASDVATDKTRSRGLWRGRRGVLALSASRQKQ